MHVREIDRIFKHARSRVELVRMVISRIRKANT
jgi:hypothetical protein